MSQRADDSIPTRQSLLLRLKQRDDTAGWREFFETYWELIYNLARKSGLNDADAQDVVQATVIRVARKIDGFKTDPRHGSFKSWLLGQARWRIGDQFRALKRESQLSGGTAKGASDPSVGARDDDTRTDPTNCVVDPAGDQLAAIWNEEWEQHVLRTALERVKARVSVKQFQIFDLHVRQGLSVTETARAVGTSMASVYMAKSRVQRLFKQELKLAANN